MSFESIPQHKQTSSIEAISAVLAEKEMKREEMSDYLFDQFLKQQLLEGFFEQLEDHLSLEDIDSMRRELAKYNDDEVYATLSLPFELRDRTFERFQKEIEKEEKDPKLLMREFIQKSTKQGFSIGYHTSPNDIQPKNGQWNIKGTENDHRDDDQSRAYYSTKYRHLFKKKNPQYIYIVRTNPETHRSDGNWNRAGMLSIVDRVPFADVVDYVEQMVRDIEMKKAVA